MTVTLDYLLPELRLQIGDTNSASYRYVDEWLLVALSVAVKKFQRYYTPAKYLINEMGEVSRNPLCYKFTTEETTEGVIEKLDEPILVIMAAISTLEGSLENSAWDTVSWKDNEVSFTNSFRGNLKDSNLNRLLVELDRLILAPTKRLATPAKGSLPGYKSNDYEQSGDY